MRESNQNFVTLKQMKIGSSGTYKCEVSGVDITAALSDASLLIKRNIIFGFFTIIL